MATVGFSGGAKLEAYLAGIVKKVAQDKTLRVGFLEIAKYPDGTNVAQVAFWNEYGTKTSPPRPFFRNMIAAKSTKWGDNLGRVLANNDYDVDKAFTIMGIGIKEQLQKSILDTNEPALSPITIMLRGMRRNDPSLIVTGSIVGEAAARVAAGETNYGASSTVLIDTGMMQGDRGVGFDIQG